MSNFDKAIRALKKALADEDYEFMLTEGLSSRLPQSDYDEHENYKNEMNEAIKILEGNVDTVRVSETFLKWLANGERGLSSDSIATKLTGIDFRQYGIRYHSHPSDPDDFKRCMKLLDQVPEFRERFYEMKDVSEVWSRLVDNWDEFEKLYYEECGTGRCPKLYDKMKEIGC